MLINSNCYPGEGSIIYRRQLLFLYTYRIRRKARYPVKTCSYTLLLLPVSRNSRYSQYENRNLYYLF